MSSPGGMPEVFTIHPQTHPWYKNKMVSFYGEILAKSVVGGPEGAEVRRYSIRPFDIPGLKHHTFYAYWPISKGTIPSGAVVRFTRGTKPYFLDPRNVTILEFHMEPPLESN